MLRVARRRGAAAGEEGSGVKAARARAVNQSPLFHTPWGHRCSGCRTRGPSFADLEEAAGRAPFSSLLGAESLFRCGSGWKGAGFATEKPKVHRERAKL